MLWQHQGGRTAGARHLADANASKTVREVHHVDRSEARPATLHSRSVPGRACVHKRRRRAVGGHPRAWQALKRVNGRRACSISGEKRRPWEAAVWTKTAIIACTCGRSSSSLASSHAGCATTCRRG